jgi:hypothetical protein
MNGKGCPGSTANGVSMGSKDDLKYCLSCNSTNHARRGNKFHTSFLVKEIPLENREQKKKFTEENHHVEIGMENLQGSANLLFLMMMELFVIEQIQALFLECWQEILHQAFDLSFYH